MRARIGKNPSVASKTKTPSANEIGIMQAGNTRVPVVFGLLAID
jgi:hypothetical protein